MSTQTLYEVHTLKGGQWVVDSTYPKRETAIEVARGLHGEKAFDGVKVIRDSFDAASGNAKESVIYDSSKQPKPKPAPAAPAASEEAAPAPARPAAASAKPAKAKSQDLTVAVKAAVLLAVILVGGFGILFGIDFLTAWVESLF